MRMSVCVRGDLNDIINEVNTCCDSVGGSLDTFGNMRIKNKKKRRSKKKQLLSRTSFTYNRGSILGPW